MLDLEQNDNYVLSLEGSEFESGEIINCIAYSKVKGKWVHVVATSWGGGGRATPILQ